MEHNMLRITSAISKCCALVAAASIAGCIEVTPETARNQRPIDLCFALAVSRAGNASKSSGDAAAAELVRRGVLSTREATVLAGGGSVVGMSEQAGLCAWGGTYERVNVTTTANGTRKQFVFGKFEYGSRRYLYTTNGVVTGTQT